MNGNRPHRMHTDGGNGIAKRSQPAGAAGQMSTSMQRPALLDEQAVARSICGSSHGTRRVAPGVYPSRSQGAAAPGTDAPASCELPRYELRRMYLLTATKAGAACWCHRRRHLPRTRPRTLPGHCPRAIGGANSSQPPCSETTMTTTPSHCARPRLPAGPNPPCRAATLTLVNPPPSSPQGRIFQIEYAAEAVKQGSVVVGIASKTHAVLCAVKARSA